MPGLISEILSGNALLALVAAGLWGVGDFSGGMGVKCAGGSVGAALRVVVLSHITSFSVLVLVAWARGDVFPHGRLLAWGLNAGVAGGLSLCAFYIALSRGAMGASAAISGVLAAGVPAMVTIATEGAPGWRKAIGFVVAGVAIWLIAAGDADHERRSTTWLAIGAGAGFGIYFVALKFAGAGGVIWPMATARMGSISACALLLLAMRGAGSVRITGTVGKWVLATALFDTSGNLMFIAATHAGRLDVAAVLASLYPASTILLAAWRNHERPTRRQGWGMALAGAAVVLIAL
jgi:drug/metabolite transporter (DMT)-like permease